MSPLLYVDTSVWFAFANRADPVRPAAHKLLRSFGGRLVTSNFVFDETITLCRGRLGHKLAKDLGEVLWSGDVADLVRALPEDEVTAWELFCDRSDKTYSYTDCVSFVMMRRLGIRTAAAFDEDFRREGFEVVP